MPSNVSTGDSSVYWEYRIWPSEKEQACIKKETILAQRPPDEETKYCSRKTKRTGSYADSICRKSNIHVHQPTESKRSNKDTFYGPAMLQWRVQCCALKLCVLESYAFMDSILYMIPRWHEFAKNVGRMAQ